MRYKLAFFMILIFTTIAFADYRDLFEKEFVKGMVRLTCC